MVAMSNPPKTRASLILRLRKLEDLEAWEQFSEIYEPFIFRMARSKGLQDADARDLTQEVMVRVANSIQNWKPEQNRGSFRGWLSRITRNLVVDFLRSKSRKIKPVSLVEEVPACAEAELFDLELRKQAFAWASEKVKGTFQESTWQAFWLTAVENRSVSEAANETGLTTGAVYIARSRAMSRLKEAVQKAINNDEEFLAQPLPENNHD